MKLPTLEQPDRFEGLYIYDFGEWTAVGYTAEEIEVLLEDPRYRGGKVYKIHHARPDGTLEIKGVPPERFLLESGMFFFRRRREDAAADFAELKRLAAESPPPGRAYLHLADTQTEGPGRYVTALIYPAEYEEEMGRWLLELDYHGGDWVEGGPSCVTNYQELDKQVLERQQLWSRSAVPTRSPEEVLANVRRAVQR